MASRTVKASLGVLLLLVLTAGSSAAAPTSGGSDPITARPLSVDDAASAFDPPVASAARADESPDNATDGVLNDSDLPADSAVSRQAASATRTTVTITVSRGAAMNTTALRRRGAVITAQHDRFIQAVVPADAVRRIRALSWVRTVRPPGQATTVAVSEGVASVGAQRLHELGVTGAGARVGVITLGVDPTSPEYADNVIRSKSFHPAGIRGEGPRHGTGVTEIVADTAPDAELYVTAYDGTSANLSRATSWLISQDVDIIVMSVGYYTQPDDGTGEISQIATNATDAGILWTNAAGNAARKHWQGSYTSPDGDALLNFDGETELNALRDGATMSAGTNVTLYLKWNDFPRSTDEYTLHLYDANDTVVASSSRYPGFPEYPAERLTTTIPSTGTYYFAIAGNASDHTVKVVGSDTVRPFQYYTREGSILAPAVAEDVTAVGAYTVQTGKLAGYSSVGPTIDGRRGIDLIAPTHVTTAAFSPSFFSGTSAAAPHVGGSAALLVSLNSSTPASELEAALTGTATDVGPSGPDIYTGAGKANVSAAAETLDPAVPLAITASATSVKVNETVAYHVTRADTGAPINATVSVGDRTYVTGSDGQLNITYGTAGRFTVHVKPSRDPPTADFAPATASINVSGPSPGTTAVEGAAFAVPESLDDEVDAYRNRSSRDLHANTFVLATQGGLYIVFTDREPTKGIASVEGATLRNISTANLTFEVIAAAETSFNTTGTTATVRAISNNSDQYRLQLVRVNAHYRRVSTLTDPEGEANLTLSTTSGVLVRNPDTAASLFQTVGRSARNLTRNTSPGTVDTILNDPRGPHLHTFSFETKFWTDAGATVDAIVLDPESAARQFVAEYDRAGIVHAEAGAPLLYVVDADFDPQRIANVSRIRSQSDSLDGEVIATEVRVYQETISVQETVEHAPACGPDLLDVQTPEGSACVNVVQDTLLHGGVAWNRVPASRNDTLLVVGVSSRHQDAPSEFSAGTYRISGEVVPTSRINESLPAGAAVVIYDIERVGAIDYGAVNQEAREIIETRTGELTTTVRPRVDDGTIVTRYDDDTDGSIDDRELLAALADYPDRVSPTDLLDLLAVYDPSD